jgi:Dyp-type peroxidase family
MTTDMFAPGSDLVIRLRQVRQDGIEFDLAKVLLPEVEQLAAARDEEVTVLMKVRDGLRADAAGLLAEPEAPVELKRQDGDAAIDFWHEARLALAANARPGLLVPPYNWQQKWPKGRATITHQASNQFLRWRPGQTLAPGTEVVLDFRTRLVDGRADMTPQETSLCVAYVEEGRLLEPPAADPFSSPAEAEPEPPLRASTSIQGEVLAGFKKDHRAILLLAFRNGEHAGSDERARAWLRELLDPPEGCGIATTAKVTAFNDQYSAARRRGDPGLGGLKAVWVNVAFTRKGIGRLQPLLEDKRLEEDFKAFWEGPAERAGILGDDADSAPQHWVFGGRGQPDIHVLLTVAGDDVDELRDEVNRQLARAVTYELDVVYQQRGDTLPGEARGQEHFGFKDGVSQPGVKGYTRPGADPHYDLDHPGTRIVPKTKFLCGKRPLLWMENGSFQVFRRLAQDVAGWRAQIAYLSEGFPLEFQMRPALLAAKLVGRWPSGTPIARAPMRDDHPAPSPDDNDFDYRGDDLGEKTPLFAHIRRLNRREDADQPRILRRGIPYGAVFDPQASGAEHQASAPRGLLFNAYMASIENQFERLQTEFANQRASEDPDPDPLVGVPRGDVIWRLRRVSGGAKKPVEQPLRLRRYVWTTGAVYAFAPSLDALRALAINDLDKLGVTASAPSQP